jgi:hypothetical protein
MKVADLCGEFDFLFTPSFNKSSVCILKSSISIIVASILALHVISYKVFLMTFMFTVSGASHCQLSQADRICCSTPYGFTNGWIKSPINSCRSCDLSSIRCVCVFLIKLGSIGSWKSCLNVHERYLVLPYYFFS